MTQASAVRKPLADSLERLSERIRQEGDGMSADKLLKLVRKLDSQQIEAAFCGHFSAGKSATINRLCGSALLPSSPIPTSANVVSIRYGAEKVRLLLHDGTERTIRPDELDEACRNGEDIAEVHIDYPHALGERIVLMDTPGIDSTDGAHKAATMAVLHRADAIFYVMDYNHVMSEMNFSFIAEWMNKGKPVYAIVNQIDKHRSAELSFEAYRNTVMEAFEAWGTRPAGLFFVSATAASHPYNEWDELKTFIQSLPDAEDRLKPRNALMSAHVLLEQHLDAAEEKRRPEREALMAEADSKSVRDAAERLELARAERHKTEEEPERLFQEAKRELDKLVENANIMPAATRDRASLFLESLQPGFKVGWWRSREKSEAERRRRLEQFAADFAEQVHIGLHLHTGELLKQAAGRAQIDPRGIGEQWERTANPVTADWLTSHVHPGAVASGEYTLNYCRTAAEAAKAYYRRAGLSLLESVAVEHRRRLEPELERLDRDIAALERMTEALEKLRRMERELEEYAQSLRSLLPERSTVSGTFPSPAHRRPEMPVGANSAAEAASADRTDAAAADRNATKVAFGSDQGQSGEDSAPERHPPRRERLVRAAASLRAAAGIVSDLPAMRAIADSLLEKANRLEHGTFTLALFGAFSAGKSSFANALIGEAALPVSPHPTTAAINRISRPCEGWEHGTARIVMKTRDQLEEELIHSLGMLGRTARSLEEALELARSLAPDAVPPQARPHYSFVRAAAQGWERVSGLLGTERKADRDEFAAFAADEAKSCFVREIELFWSCALTEAGITLVDTPGADSVHARHTGVAFSFLKSADAILFVTYYNHAFSRADKQFLEQLGRVRDSFELDKMFFVVNASDLASGEEELRQVVDYAREQFVRHGIREPRIFPVSSLLALQGKRENGKAPESSGMPKLEDELFRFIYEELSELTILAGRKELDRAAAALRRWLAEAEQSGEERRKSVERMEEALVRFEQRWAEPDLQAELRSLEQEARELVYYVKQRTEFRFGEWFLASFHPSLWGGERVSAETALVAAWRDLLGQISFALSQEMLATSLRMEKRLGTLLDERMAREAAAAAEAVPAFVPPNFGEREFPTPSVAHELPPVPVDASWLKKFFRNPKQFFEGGGRDRLKEEAQRMLAQAVAQYADEHGARFAAHYSGLLREQAGREFAALAESLRGQVESLRAADDGTQAEDIRERLKDLDELSLK